MFLDLCIYVSMYLCIYVSMYLCVSFSQRITGTIYLLTYMFLLLKELRGQSIFSSKNYRLTCLLLSFIHLESLAEIDENDISIESIVDQNETLSPKSTSNTISSLSSSLLELNKLNNAQLKNNNKG